MRKEALTVLMVLGVAGSIVGCGSDGDPAEPKIWGAPVRIDDANSLGVRGDLAAVDMDASGNALAIWRQGGDAANNGQIQSSRLTAGGAWSAPASIGSSGGRVGTGPIDLAMDSAGNAIAAWESNRLSGSTNYLVGCVGARFSASSGWSAEGLFDGMTLITGASTLPAVQDVQVGLNQGGYALVAYSSNFDAHISVAIEPPGTILNDPSSSLDSAPDFAFFPKLAFDGSGKALLIWGQFNPGEIVSRRFDPATGLAAPVIVTGPMPAVQAIGLRGFAVNASGAAVAIWVQTTSDLAGLEYWASSAPAGGTWSTPALLAPQQGYNSADRVSSGSVAVDAKGNAIALLPQAADTPQARLMFSRSAAGSGWSAPVEIGPTVGGPISRSSIAFDADGNAIAVWLQSTTTGDKIIQALFDGKAWTAPAVLSTNTNSGAPRLAVAPDGAAVATWYGDQAIWAARFE